jgi:hypothetical protein
MTPTAPSTTSAPTILPLEAFFERVLGDSPFVANRVLQPATAEADAESIHQGAFRELVRLAELARDQRLGVGVVLWGEAGVGKSHLLARLARWAEKDRQASFIYFQNLQARADNLARYVLHCTVSALTGGRSAGFHDTPLYLLINRILKIALRGREEPPPSWSQAEAAFHGWVDHLLARDLGRAALLDRTIFRMLFRFFQSAYQAHESGRENGIARRAVLWLSGEALDPGEAATLGLQPAGGLPEALALRDEQHIKQVFVALAELGFVRRQPLLLCFDQVDNLETDQIAALSRFLHALLDSAPNLFVVTTGVKATLLEFRETGVVRESAWDRLTQFEVTLQRITAPEGSRIVQARLDRFLAPFRDLDRIKILIQNDPHFPLGAGWFQEFLAGKPDIRPRDVITRAREGWRREQEKLRQAGGTSWLDNWSLSEPAPCPSPSLPPLEERIDQVVDLKIAEHKKQREQNPQTFPPSAANLAGLTEALLRQCRGSPPPASVQELDRFAIPRVGTRPIYDLVVRSRRSGGTETSSGLLILVTNGAGSVAFALRRLLDDQEPPDQVLLITDQRQPLRLGTKGREYLNRLRRFGRFRHVELSLADYAGLDALQAAVTMARSGDLEVEMGPGQSRPVTEAEVIQSHHRRQRYLACPPLREVFLGDAPGEGATTDDRPQSGRDSLDKADLSGDQDTPALAGA